MKQCDFIEDMGQKLCDVLPGDFHEAKGDLKQAFHQILQAAFAKMDLVTREEFDVQCQVLARSREKIEALSAQVLVLEEALSKKTAD
jgi:BMFP domain-containing protein YqiC